jgi:hypothetical protein
MKRMMLVLVLLASGVVAAMTFAGNAERTSEPVKGASDRPISAGYDALADAEFKNGFPTPSTSARSLSPEGKPSGWQLFPARAL